MSDNPSDYQIGGDHYTEMWVQPWEVIDGWPLEQAVGFYRGNAIKYLLRMGSKGPALEDARKAQHYLAKLIASLEIAPSTGAVNSGRGLSPTPSDRG